MGAVIVHAAGFRHKHTCMHDPKTTHRRRVPGDDHPGGHGAVDARQVVQEPGQLLRAQGGLRQRAHRVNLGTVNPSSVSGAIAVWPCRARVFG